MNSLVKIGLNICTRRKELGYSQEKLALEAGLDRTYIPKVEKGKINITINSLEKIAKALGVKLIDLLK
ncbi:MAG: helix-turn-helix transcriptional regulator [Bacteroidales bacterium]|nr:helix-turn-helix transcriptional regulator [Bacteroidales bacterium]